MEMLNVMGPRLEVERYTRLYRGTEEGAVG